jgi:hypothetical protein
MVVCLGLTIISKKIITIHYLTVILDSDVFEQQLAIKLSGNDVTHIIEPVMLTVKLNTLPNLTVTSFMDGPWLS